MSWAMIAEAGRKLADPHALMAVVVVALTWRATIAEPLERKAQNDRIVAELERLNEREGEKARASADQAAAMREQAAATRELVLRIDAVLLRGGK